MNVLQDNRSRPSSIKDVRFAFVRTDERFYFRGRLFRCSAHPRVMWVLPFLCRVDLDMEHRAWLFPWTKVQVIREPLPPWPAGMGETVVLPWLRAEDYPEHIRTFGLDAVRAECFRRNHEVHGRGLPPNNDDGRTGPSA